jgi:hypothetical protein
VPRSNSGTRIAHIPSHLFLETTACEIEDANCRLPQFSNHGGKVAVRDGCALALWHLENDHHRLRADGFQSVERACRARKASRLTEGLQPKTSG